MILFIFLIVLPRGAMGSVLDYSLNILFIQTLFCLAFLHVIHISHLLISFTFVAIHGSFRFGFVLNSCAI